MVVDGLRADQLAFMPQLTELAERGTFYPQARAQMLAETGPNHTAMITGMRADRNGHPGNAVPGLADRVGEDPRYLKADSLFTLVERQAPEATAASVNAKTYVVNTARHDRTASGDSDTDSVYDPPVTAPDDSTRDAFTGPEGLRVSRELDPDLLWWNLGDVDRAGHVDVSGSLFEGVPVDGNQPAFQGAALAQADQMIRNLVEELEASGRWERTVFIVTADHSMDWSFADRFVDLADAFEGDDLLAGEVVTAVNGGACLFALRSPDDPRAQERLVRMRELALAADGVDEALYIRPNPLDGGERHWVGRVHPDWGLLGDYTGELIVTVEQGWRIGHGGHDSNPIPGNHGHTVTLPIPVIISGGWDGIAARTIEPDGDPGPADSDPTQAQNIDLAPTAAWLLGLNPPPGGFDGRVLTEAFTRRPGTRVEVSNVHSLPEISRLADADAYGTAVTLSREVWPDGLGGGGPADTLPLTVGDELADDEVAEIERLAGEDPADTARLVAIEMGVHDDNRQVIVADGEPRIALAAVPAAAARRRPMLLARDGGLPTASRQALDDLGIDRVLVVGDGDVLSAAVADGLRAEGAPTDDLYLAPADGFPEALAVGPAVHALRGSLVLLSSQSLASAPNEPTRD